MGKKEEMIGVSPEEKKIIGQIEFRTANESELIKQQESASGDLGAKMSDFEESVEILSTSNPDAFKTVNKAMQNIKDCINKNKSIDKYVKTIGKVKACSSWVEEGGCVKEVEKKYGIYKEKAKDVADNQIEINNLRKN